MRTRTILLGLLLPVLIACGGDDDGPTAPAAPVFDRISVSLDQIEVTRDCDGGGGGEFAYQFYVVVVEDGEEVETILSPSWNSFTAGNNTAWDPGVDATFTLERREGVRFQVRMRMREWDGTTEDFSQGTFVAHANAAGVPAWSPTATGGVTDWSVYDGAQRRGNVEWDFRTRADCNGWFRYSVLVEAATE